MLKLKRIAADGLSLNSVTDSVKVGNPLSFLKIIVRKRLCRGKVFLPLEGMKVKIRGIERREEDFEILEMIYIEDGFQGKE